MYNAHRTTKEIASDLRKDLKKKFPDYKVSVTRDHSSINVVLLEAPFDAILIERKEVGVNQYHLQDEIGKRIHEKAGEFFLYVEEVFSKDYYDNSDSMTDYFDVAFYKDYSIGKWDKPFINTSQK